MDYVKALIMRHALGFVLVLSLLIIDWICGTTAALFEHDFQSQKMRLGLANKCKEIGFLLMSYIADELTGIGELEIPLALSGMISTYIVVMELGSIAENLGYVLPDGITKFLPNSRGEDKK